MTISIRRFVWNDLQALLELAYPDDKENPKQTDQMRSRLTAELHQPRSDPARNVLLAERNGRLNAYAKIDLEINIYRAVLWIHVKPKNRRTGVASALFDVVSDYSKTVGVKKLHVPIHVHDPATVAFLSASGMRPVRNYWRMRTTVANWNNFSMASRHLTPRVKVQPFRPDADMALLTDLQNLAFSDSWGFSPNSVEEVRKRFDIPGYGPEGVIFLALEDEFVAYAWTAMPPGGQADLGEISMTGVSPDHRVKGLGRQVVSGAIRNLAQRGAYNVELEVDSENEAALSLYGKFGFQRVSEIVWYELLL